MPSIVMLCIAMKDVLRDILSVTNEESKEVECTTEYILISPHSFLNFVLMAEQNPATLSKFRAKLTKILKDSGS